MRRRAEERENREDKKRTVQTRITQDRDKKKRNVKGKQPCREMLMDNIDEQRKPHFLVVFIRHVNVLSSQVQSYRGKLFVMK